MVQSCGQSNGIDAASVANNEAVAARAETNSALFGDRQPADSEAAKDLIKTECYRRFLRSTGTNGEAYKRLGLIRPASVKTTATGTPDMQAVRKPHERSWATDLLLAAGGVSFCFFDVFSQPMQRLLASNDL